MGASAAKGAAAWGVDVGGNFALQGFSLLAIAGVIGRDSGKESLCVGVFWISEEVGNGGHFHYFAEIENDNAVTYVTNH